MMGQGRPKKTDKGGPAQVILGVQTQFGGVQAQFNPIQRLPGWPRWLRPPGACMYLHSCGGMVLPKIEQLGACSSTTKGLPGGQWCENHGYRLEWYMGHWYGWHAGHWYRQCRGHGNGHEGHIGNGHGHGGCTGLWCGVLCLGNGKGLRNLRG